MIMTRGKKLSNARSTSIKKKFPGVYREQRGTLTHTAKALGVPSTTLIDILAHDPELQAIRREIDHEIDEEVHKRLLGIALGSEKGHPTASIFWLKARAGWVDRQVVEHKGKLDYVPAPSEDSESAPAWGSHLRVVSPPPPPDPGTPEHEEGPADRKISNGIKGVSDDD